jgi:GNAT superfamily N-acetyltransferase
MPPDTLGKTVSFKITQLAQVEFTYALSRGLDDVFFEASGRTRFSTSEDRERFRRRWLADYLVCDIDCCFIALDGTDQVIGYVVGSLENPAVSPRYADLTYFSRFAPITAQYPAHLHINVAPQYRSAGVGARLVAAFLERAAACGAPGAHIVTGEGMRNVGFYARNGFVPLDTAPWRDGHVVMLGRALTPSDN